MIESLDPPRAERILSGITLGCCILGILVCAFCLFCSFFASDYPDNTTYLVEYNLIVRISQSMPLDAASFLALDGWGAVPIFVLYLIFIVKRPHWVSKAILPVSIIAFAPGIWSHFYYMPIYGCVSYDHGLRAILDNSFILFLAMLSAITFALLVWLRNKRLGEKGKPAHKQ